MTTSVAGGSFEDLLTAHDESYSAEEAQQTSLRPTLIIGLGGTGEAVVSTVKKRLHAYFGEYSGAFQLLAIDTTVPSPGSVLGDIERLRIGDLVDPDAAIRNLGPEHPIRQWWPWGKEAFRIGQPIMTGAGQTRAVGRMALWFDISKLESRIKHLIKLTGDVTLPVPVGGARVCKVYIVSSVCGGTGAGTLLDMAYLARYWTKQAGLDPRITGVLVMPDAFEQILGTFPLQMNWVRANAYATLKELEHFTRTGEFQCVYRDDLRVNVTGRPFDVCYLVGTRNTHAKVLRSLDTLINIIAHQVFLEIGTPMGVNHTNSFDNPGALQELTEDGKPTAFSSFGVGALVHPCRELRYYMSACLAGELLDSVLLGGGKNGQLVTQKVAQFIAAQKICEDPADDVIDALRVDAQGQVLQVPISEDLFAGIKRANIPAEITNHERAIRDRLGAYKAVIAQNAEKLAERVRPALSAQVAEITRHPDEGLPLATQFLTALKAKLTLFLDEMNQEREDQQKTFKSATASYERAGESASRSAHGGFFSTSYKDHLQEWVDHAIVACRAYVGMEARISAAAFFAGLIRDVDTLLARLVTLRDTIEAARTKLRMAASRVQSAGGRQSDTEYQLVTSIVPRDQFSRLFADARAKHLGVNLGDLYKRVGTPLEWAKLDADELAMRVGDWALGHVTSLVPDDLLHQWKALGKSSKEIRDAINGLVERCAPLWTLDRAKFNPGGHLQSTRAIGVGAETSGNWDEMLGKLQNTDRVLTHNSTEVSVLNAEHGMPLYAVFYMEGLRDTYLMCRRNQMARGVKNPRPLHIHKDWGDTLEDLFPERDVDALDAWAIGLCRGVLYRKGHYYYVHAEAPEGTEDDIQLGQGRVTAFDEFKRRSSLVDRVRDQVDAWVADAGYAKAREALTEYVGVLKKEIELAKTEDVKELMQRELRAIINWCDEIERVR